jgi:hypothetical protein
MIGSRRRRCDASIFARRGRCLAGCTEGSDEEAELKRIVDAI